jgi:hypothetical protein
VKLLAAERRPDLHRAGEPAATVRTGDGDRIAAAAVFNS